MDAEWNIVTGLILKHIDVTNKFFLATRTK